MDIVVNKIEKTEINKVKIEFKVGAADFAEAIEKAYKKEGKKYNISGFRKGKSPKNMIERMYGEGVFYNEAIDIIFPDAYMQVVEENKIDVVSRPDVDIGEEIGADVGVTFICEVTVSPEVKLGQYKGLETEKKETIITEDDIMVEVNKAAEKNARMINVEDRPVADGDIAVIDYIGTLNGEAFEGGSADGYELGIGSKTFIPGFEEKIIGHNIGEEFDIDITFPEDYNSEELKGKAVVFHITLHAIKVKELPTIDDEFASDVSTFDTLDEYKADIRKILTEQKEKSNKDSTESDLISKATANAEMVIPDVMYDEEVQQMMKNMDMRLRNNGLDLETYMKYLGMDQEKMKEMYMPEAKRSVASRLVIQAIVKEENIQISEEELEEEFARFAKEIDKPVEDFKKILRPSDIENVTDDLKMRKAVDIIVNEAKYV